MPDHVLVETQVEVLHKGKPPVAGPTTRTEYHCTACDRTWREKPTTPCPGAKIYQWEPWPDGLLTRKQLAAKKLNPGPLAGVISYDKSADGDGWLRLYRESEATPKPPLSLKRQAALDKARAAAEEARHCSNCGRTLHTSRELRIQCCGLCEQNFRAEKDRIEAAQMAHNLVCEGDFVVWDTETTDLNGYLIEIAAVDPFGKVLLDQRVRPQCLIEQGAYEVHGIREGELVGCPTFWEIAGPIRRALHNQRWIIYNADFDTRILSSEMDRPDVASYFDRYPIAARDSFCAMHMYAAFCGDWHNYYKSYRWQKLGAAAAALGVDADFPAHSALGDCFRTLGVLYSMAEWYTKEILK